jgi:hypothetical protein
MEALFAEGDEIHAFVKFQIMRYASGYEAGDLPSFMWQVQGDGGGKQCCQPLQVICCRGSRTVTLPPPVSGKESIIHAKGVSDSLLTGN